MKPQIKQDGTQRKTGDGILCCQPAGNMGLMTAWWMFGALADIENYPCSNPKLERNWQVLISISQHHLDKNARV